MVQFLFSIFKIKTTLLFNAIIINFRTIIDDILLNNQIEKENKLN